MNLALQLVMPVIMALIAVYGKIKGLAVFSCFTEGVKDGFKTIYSIIPSLIGLITAIGMLRASGALDIITQLLSPIFGLMGFPQEVTPLIILKPISGSGSLAVLNQIVSENGANTRIAKIAAVMAGSTETTFYCLAVYFSATKIRKTGTTVPCALFGDLTSMLIACLPLF